MGERLVQVLGWDHHRTPVQLRERLALPGERLEELIARLQALPGVDEALVLSTCNRTECYLAGEESICSARSLMARMNDLMDADVRETAYAHCGVEAVQHLFRVVSSLESLVLGEYQIAHQLKQAWQLAQRVGGLGPVLDPLVQQALAVGKRVRSETGIGRHKLSVASVAVELASHIHGSLSDTRLLVCGAGEMAELTVVHLIDQGVRQVSVINRSQDRAEQLIGLQRRQGVRLHALPWEQLGPALAAHDIVITSTAAPHPVIGREQVARALERRRNPLMLIDLAVPRDIETAVDSLDDAYRYDIDDLDRIVAANRDLRGEEVGEAEQLIQGEVERWRQRSRVEARAVLRRLAGLFDEIIAKEHRRLCNKRPELQAHEALLQDGLRRVANKLAHPLFRWVGGHTDDPEALALIGEILDLELAVDDQDPANLARQHETRQFSQD
ncbi:MAG: glutamyl-tRNA reductase [Planctomycetota bacterium]